MDIAASGLQQANVALSMIKNKAQTEQALVNIIQQSIQSAPLSSRGSNLDVTV